MFQDQAANLGYSKSEDYFPIDTILDSAFYQPIPYDGDIDIHSFFEVELGIDKLVIDDSFLQIGVSERNTSFVNTKHFKHKKDTQSWYKFDGPNKLIASFNFGVTYQGKQYKR